ncbi:hypothetical protein JY96_11980 [Aquabacterium sp. NJ1]|uniref:hypothetical protein n=1 Tax=Aquabacterium sp. NJ1 TaxID=1538295 RepID=UPI00052D7B98|nr:hypothetical protein [Aquabacterium sp. NJ1]KGM40517.1 hypothetical protein JY96_11980 [Aquabacterium sp. NJ1]
MQRFDVCNGDADGLCATVQWRWHEPGPATLITGLKRDIALLAQVPAQARPGDEVNVFDLSMQRNQPALQQLLDAGVRVRYVDHHATGAVPEHSLLQAHVDLGSEVCTSLLVDRLLNGACRHWALVGAYGDNLTAVADRLAIASGLDAAQRTALRRLGEGINYNAYGNTEADVHLPPARLYALLARYQDPLDLLAHEALADELDALRQSDLAQAQQIKPLWQGPQGRVLCLPDAAWARRVQGVLANELANAQPEQAHAVLCWRAEGGYSVSLRAPLLQPGGAATVCQAFGGNGRARAAGIDVLPEAALPRFIAAFAAAHWSAPA